MPRNGEKAERIPSFTMVGRVLPAGGHGWAQERSDNPAISRKAFRATM
jgi:hypothetical protein